MSRPVVDMPALSDAHLDAFVPAAWRFGEAVEVKAVLRQALGHEGSFAAAMVVDGLLVGVGGIVRLAPQLGWAMFMPAKAATMPHWHHGLPVMRRWIETVHAHGVRRIEANIAADFAEAHMTALALGFRYDGDRDGWDGTDRAAMIYTRLSPETREGPWVRECRRELHLARLAEHCPHIVERVRRGFAPRSARGS